MPIRDLINEKFPSLLVNEVTGFNRSSDKFIEDETYFEVYLEAVRLEYSRKLATNFHVGVHAAATYSSFGDAQKTVSRFVTPGTKTGTDAADLKNVLLRSKKLLGPIPWRGGEIDLEFGLFSVKAGNLLSSLTGYIAELSSAIAGLHTSKMEALFPLITQGTDILAGQKNDVKLHVGIESSHNLTQGCTMALVAIDRTTLKDTELEFSEGILKLNRKPVECAYCVISIVPCMENHNFGGIPDLSEGYSRINDSVRSGDIQAAQNALKTFRLIALSSPDITTKDAMNLVAKIQQKLDEAFPQTTTSQSTDSPDKWPDELGGISLYS